MLHNTLRLHPGGKRPRLQKTEGENNYIKVKRAVDKMGIAYLIKQLDDVTSILIRNMYADQDGYTKCYTTGKTYHWTKIQAGHFHSRKHYAIRWDLNNIRPQSVHANIFSQGMQFEFQKNLLAEIGQEAFDELERRKNNDFKLDKFVLQILIFQYRQNIKDLKKDYMIKIP